VARLLSDVVSILRELVVVPGPSGYEEEIRAFIRGKLESLGFRPSVDGLGNLYVEVGGGDRSVLLAAHMDELGLVVTHIEEDGLLRFTKLGGIDDRILPSSRVELLGGKGRVPGVIGLKPPHLQLERGQQPEVVPWHKLAIDIGASSREEVLEMGIDILTPGVLEKPWVELGGKAIASRAIDDRMGCAVLLALAESIARGEVRPRSKLILAWTVQEEVGLRGALGLARSLRPDLMIAVDTVSCCEPAVTGLLKPGGGAVIRAVDLAYIAGRKLVEWIESIARSRGVAVQKTAAGGGTDAAAFQRAGVPSIALGAPVKYTHSTVETIFKSDLYSLLELIKAIAEEEPPK
jgi:putative aminopeptidase FrvX